MKLKKIFVIVLIISIIVALWYFYSKPKKPAEIEDFLNAKIVRKLGAVGIITTGEPWHGIISVPAVIYGVNIEPLLIQSEKCDFYLECYKPENIIILDDDIERDSIKLAHSIWDVSESAIIISQNNYPLALTLAPVSGYLGIPLIITKSTKNVQSLLQQLQVKWTIMDNILEPYGNSITISSVEEAQNFVLKIMQKKNLPVEYIAVVNTNDITTTYGIPKVSQFGPYLAVARKGIVMATTHAPLEENIFATEKENWHEVAEVANQAVSEIKIVLNSTFDKLKNFNFYDKYLTTPYLALLGDPYVIPFYYIPELQQGMISEYVRWIATDDYYGDLDEEIEIVELAVGRVLTLSVEDTAALISRTLCYDRYMPNWVADSPLNTITNAEWKSTAYLGVGDDWNGAIWGMTMQQAQTYWYLRNCGYTVYVTKGATTGEHTAQELLKLYTSSGIIYIMAHGSPSGYNMVDGINAEDVKEWPGTGPSFMLLVSCSAGRIDVKDIQDTITLAFMSVGMNTYIAGTRTEYTTGSPYICDDILKDVITNNLPVGIAHRNAKNNFVNGGGEYYHAGIKELYGDPVFIPYTL